MIDYDKFSEFLESFESNPFRLHEDKAFKKQLIENLIKYTYDHMSLLTAVLLLKKKFTIEEVVNNYYASVDAFGYDVFWLSGSYIDSTKYQWGIIIVRLVALYGLSAFRFIYCIQL